MSLSQFPHEHGQSGTETVTLVDENGRSLDCFVERSLAIEGETYLLLMPVDSTVTIIAWDSHDDAGATWLEDEEEIEEVFPDAKAVLAEHDLSLKHTAFTLTVTGEFPASDEEDLLTLEIESDNGQYDTEEFQFLATFYHEGQEYEIYTPVEPLLFFAKFKQGGDLELTSPEEFQQLQPYLEELLFEELD